jgi:hypothetical protein
VQPATAPIVGGELKKSTGPYPAHDSIVKQPAPADHTKPTALVLSTPLPTQEHPRVQEWKVVATARANSFNLGGHIDQAGVVDSLASPYLRAAFKKAPNYNKLPPEAKAWIEAPNIDLAKLAPYRALLGIDDTKIEADQAVKFVRVASTRGIDDAELDNDADVLAFPASPDKSDLLVLPPIR